MNTHLVDNLLLLHVLLAQHDHLPPQRLVLLLHGREPIVQHLLLAAHHLHLGQHPVQRLRLDHGRGRRGGGGHRLVLRLVPRVRNLPFDVFQHKGMTALEARVRELHLVPVKLEAAVVQGGDLVETVCKSIHYNC